MADLRRRYGTHTHDRPDGTKHTSPNDILFRGQGDSLWSLTTTLERRSDESFTVERYLIRAGNCVHELESATDRRWSVSPHADIRAELSLHADSLSPHLPHYDFLVYLRQMGFPSPLLDWTESPYVAAFFAMESRVEAERCAVFMFIETPEGGKAISERGRLIKTWGRYVTAHARHFAQKAQYTTATKWNADRRAHVFCSHEEPPEHEGVVVQDVVVKLTVPRASRREVLTELNDYNINHYTLFQTEDALVQALGHREFDLR